MAVTKDRVTIQEAARRLGVKDDAIRKRIQRGTLEHDKNPDGRVYVYMDASKDGSADISRDSTQYSSKDESHPPPQDTSYATAELVDALHDQIAHLRGVIETRDRELAARTEEIRRRDHIIAALTERIPELEPASNAPESPVGASEEGGEEDDEARLGLKRRSWLYRFFYGP